MNKTNPAYAVNRSADLRRCAREMMKRTMSQLLSVAALLLATSCGTVSPRLPRPEGAMALSFPYTEGARVCEMRPISTTRIRRHLGDCTVYATTALNAWANPAFVNQPLIIAPSINPMLLPDYTVSAAFVSKLKLSAASVAGAREILLLLADIQSWQLCRGIPNEMREREEADDPEWLAKWQYSEKKTPEGWVFECVFLTDPFIRHYTQFTIMVSNEGKITVENSQSLGLAPGHSGYI